MTKANLSSEKLKIKLLIENTNKDINNNVNTILEKNTTANNSNTDNNITGFLENSSSTNSIIPSTLVASTEINKNTNAESTTILSPTSTPKNLHSENPTKDLINSTPTILENSKNIINNSQESTQKTNYVKQESPQQSSATQIKQSEQNKYFKELGNKNLTPKNVKEMKIKYLPLKNGTK